MQGEWNRRFENLVRKILKRQHGPLHPQMRIRCGTFENQCGTFLNGYNSPFSATTTLNTQQNRNSSSQFANCELGYTMKVEKRPLFAKIRILCGIPADEKIKGRSPARPPRRFLSHAETRRAQRWAFKGKARCLFIFFSCSNFHAIVTNFWYNISRRKETPNACRDESN